MRLFFLLLACILIHPSLTFAQDSLHLTMPVSRIIYQRDNSNEAMVPVRGSVSSGITSVKARLVVRTLGQAMPTKWTTIKVGAGGTFEGDIKGRGGWYNLELQGLRKKKVISSTTVERVGVGEVFVIVGHSVAQGGEINLDGASDDRVSTVSLHEHSPENEQYLKTGDPQYLPPPVFVQAGNGIAQAPFAHGSYFWSKFADLLVKKENVPVLIFNAAFGGTNLVHWSKAARGIQFEHGFVRSNIRMPYINLVNAFKKYVSLTGVRALLADHGQNDLGEKSADTIFHNYQIFIEHARADLGYDDLAMVVNRQMPNNAPAVRIAQDRMTKEPHCFPGPDYDLLSKEDRYDGIHLSASGASKAAVMWADALTPEFFKESKPWQPKF